MRLALLAALLASFCSCASLRVGWARVDWLGGKVAPVAKCTARVNAEGDVEMTCAGVGRAEADLWWGAEKHRSEGGI